MKVCYNCIFELTARTGKPTLGNACGFGKCESCDAVRHLYVYTPLDSYFGWRVERYDNRERVSGVQAFGWALVLMVIALAVALCLLSNGP